MKCSVFNGSLVVTDDANEKCIWKGHPENRNVEDVIFISEMNLIIIRYSFSKDFKDFPDKNIICMDSNYSIRWHADLPTTEPDRYVQMFYDHGTLKANSFSCYLVEIDLNDGHIISHVFTK